jgi:hypothetical protein
MNLEPDEIYHEATRLGLRLIPRGDRLEVIPKSRLTPEFTDILLEHKTELLAFLEVADNIVRPNRASWLHVAKQLFAGEFDGADNYTLQSLTVGLRAIRDPRCQRALERLRRYGQPGYDRPAR